MDLNASIKQRESEQAEAVRSLNDRDAELKKKEEVVRTQTTSQDKRRIELDIEVQCFDARMMELRKREDRLSIEESKNGRVRAILCGALTTLGPIEDFEDEILQKSKDIAVIESRISRLEEQLEIECQTKAEQMQTIDNLNGLNGGKARQINTLVKDIRDKEKAIQAHLRTITERGEQINDHLGKLDFLEYANRQLQLTLNASDNTLKDRVGEVERLTIQVKDAESSSVAQQQGHNVVAQQLQDVQSEVHSLRAAKKEMETLRKQMESLQTTTAAEAAAKQNRIAQLETKMQERELCLTQQISSSNEKLQKMDETLTSEEQRRSKLESDKKALGEHAMCLERSLAETQQEVEGLQQVNEQSRAQISELSEDAEKKQEEITKWQNQVTNANKLLVTEKNTTSRLRNERNSNQKQVSQFSAQATKDKEQVEDLLVRLSTKQQQVTDLSSRLSTGQKQILALSTQLDTERQRVEAFSSQLDTEKEQVAALSSKLGTIQQQVTHFETLQQGHMVRDEEFRKQSTQYKSLEGAFNEIKTTKQALEKERNKLCDNLQKFRDHDRKWNAIEARSREMLESQDDFIKKCKSVVTKVSKDQQPIESLETALNFMQDLVDGMLFNKEVAIKIFQMLSPSQSKPSVTHSGTDILNAVLHGTEKLFEEMAGLLDQIDQGKSSETKLTDSLKASNDEIVRLKSELAEAEKARESMVVVASKDLQLSKEQYSATVKANEELQLQLSQIKEDKRKLQDRGESTRLELTKAKKVGDEWRAESTQWKMKYQASQATVSDHTSEIAELRRLQDQLDSEKIIMQSDYDEMDSRLVSMERESDKLKKQHQDSQKLAANQTGEISHMMQLLASQKDRHTGEIQSLTKELTASRRHVADLQHRYDQVSGMSSGRSRTVLPRDNIETDKRTTLRRSNQQEEQDTSDMVTTEQDSVLDDTRQRKRTRTARATPRPSHARTSVTGGSSSAEANGANPNNEPWIAIDEFRDDTFRYGALPQALFDKVRQQMELWDSKKGPGSTTGSWTEGAKGRAKGQVKCAHHFTQHEGSNMGLGHACDKCDQRRLVSVGLLEGKVQLRPLVLSNRGAASKADMEYWVRAAP